MVDARDGLEHVVYIKGVGNKPIVQDDLARLWLPHGLAIDHQPIDWSAENYHEQLARVAGRIIELSAEGNVSVVAASGGVKPLMSLLVRNPDHIHRGVAICGKFGAFDFSTDPTQIIRRPSLVAASDVMEEDYKNLEPQALKKVCERLLWLYTPIDETIPEDPTRPTQVEALAIPHDGHLRSIEYALTFEDGAGIAQYIKHGNVPSFV